MNSDHDIDAIVQAFQARYGLVVGVARRYAPTPDLVYDIVQQAFIDFLEGALKSNWNLQRDAGPILYTITKNRALMLLRRRKNHSSEVLQAVWDRLTNQTQQYQDASPDEAEELENELTALKHCMDKLPEKSRRYIERHYFGATPVKNIAEEEQIDAKILRQTFCRIRVKLRECMERFLKKRP